MLSGEKQVFTRLFELSLLAKKHGLFAGNPIAAVEVKVAPDGTIIGRRLVTSSGVAAWDEAVLRAIDRTAVLPRNPDGPTPPSMLIEFRPRDL